MKYNIYALLSIAIIALSSCSKDEITPGASDFRPNIVGEFTTYKITSYDKSFTETGNIEGTAMIEIKNNASTSNAINVFEDGTFKHALVEGKEMSTAYTFDYLTNGTIEGYAGVNVDSKMVHAAYYKANNTLEIYNALYVNGLVDSYSVTIISGKK
mgnify:CR=1 FL=1